MPFDAHDGAQNFATAGPQALVHHLHGVLGEGERSLSNQGVRILSLASLVT